MPKISFPIRKAYSSDNYDLMIVDDNGITHYWTTLEEYDGHSSAPENDLETGINMN